MFAQSHFGSKELKNCTQKSAKKCKCGVDVNMGFLLYYCYLFNLLFKKWRGGLMLCLHDLRVQAADQVIITFQVEIWQESGFIVYVCSI